MLKLNAIFHHRIYEYDLEFIIMLYDLWSDWS